MGRQMLPPRRPVGRGVGGRIVVRRPADTIRSGADIDPSVYVRMIRILIMRVFSSGCVTCQFSIHYSLLTGNDTPAGGRLRPALLQGLLPALPGSLLSALPRGPLTVLPRGLVTALPRSPLTTLPWSLLTAPLRGLLSALSRGFLSALPRGLLSAPPRGLVPALPRGLLTALPQSLAPVLPPARSLGLTAGEILHLADCRLTPTAIGR